jgi:carboxypeptidase C (cathepsin A)
MERIVSINDLPYILFLPTYAAIAWYHHKLTSESQSNFKKTLDEVEEFVLSEYLVASAYYDLDTPYFASKYATNHLGLDPKLRNNLTLIFYEAGHQMYTHLPSLEKLKADVSDFFRKAISEVQD